MRDLFTISILLLSICITANAQTYPEMVLVEGGSFTMGHTEIEGEPDAQPPHEVTLKSFKMAKTETTVTQWRTHSKATGHTFASAMDGKTDEAAMAYINYSEAIVYCDWLSNKTG